MQLLAEHLALRCGRPVAAVRTRWIHTKSTCARIPPRVRGHLRAIDTQWCRAADHGTEQERLGAHSLADGLRHSAPEGSLGR